MATKFIATVNKTGEDYGSITSAESALQCNLTAAATKVFSHGGITGTVSDGASVTGLTSGATATVCHASTTQILLKSISGTFQNGEVVQVSAGNSVTLSNAGDSAIISIQVYNDDGDLADQIGIDGTTSNSTNYMEITVPSGERHSGTPSSGATITHTTTGLFNGQCDIADEYVILEYLVFKITMNHANTVCIRTSSAASGLSTAPIIRNNILQRVGGSTVVSQSGIYASNGNGSHKAFNNIIIGFNSGIKFDNTNVYQHYNNTTKGCTTGVNFENSTYRSTIKNHLSIGDTTGFANDIGDSNSINNLAEDTTAHFGATYATGTTTSTTANKLVDSGAGFVAAGVQVGSVVKNGTDTTYAYVTAVDSATQLSLSADIFTSGETYSIYKSYRGSVTCVDKTNNDLHLVSGDTNAIDRGTDLGSTDGVQYDADGYDRDSTGVTWDIGADEYVSTSSSSSSSRSSSSSSSSSSSRSSSSSSSSSSRSSSSSSSSSRSSSSSSSSSSRSSSSSSSSSSRSSSSSSSSSSRSSSSSSSSSSRSSSSSSSSSSRSSSSSSSSSSRSSSSSSSSCSSSSSRSSSSSSSSLVSSSSSSSSSLSSSSSSFRSSSSSSSSSFVWTDRSCDADVWSDRATCSHCDNRDWLARDSSSSSSFSSSSSSSCSSSSSSRSSSSSSSSSCSSSSSSRSSSSSSRSSSSSSRSSSSSSSSSCRSSSSSSSSLPTVFAGEIVEYRTLVQRTDGVLVWYYIEYSTGPEGYVWKVRYSYDYGDNWTEAVVYTNTQGGWLSAIESDGDVHVFDDSVHKIFYPGNPLIDYANLGLSGNGAVLSVLVDGSNQIHVIYRGSLDIYTMWYTVWNGSAWSTPVVAATDGYWIGGAMMCMDSSGKLHIAYNNLHNTLEQPNYDLYYVTNSSGSWASPVNLLSGSNRYATNPKILCNGSDVIQIVCRDTQRALSDSASRIYHFRMTSATTYVRTTVVDWYQVINSPKFSMDQSNNVYVVYSKTRTEGLFYSDTDVFYVKSTDNGATWNTPTNVTNLSNPYYGIPLATFNEEVYAPNANILVTGLAFWWTKYDSSAGGYPYELFFYKTPDATFPYTIGGSPEYSSTSSSSSSCRSSSSSSRSSSSSCSSSSSSSRSSSSSSSSSCSSSSSSSSRSSSSSSSSSSSRSSSSSSRSSSSSSSSSRSSSSSSRSSSSSSRSSSSSSRSSSSSSSSSSSLGEDLMMVFNMNGADGSTTFTDSGPLSLSATANGNAQIDTAQSKYGGSSGLFDGTGDYVSVAYASAINFGSRDITIDCWVRFSNVGTNNTIFGRYTSGSSYLYLTFEGGTSLRFRDYTGSNNIDFARTVSVAVDTWYHVAAVRSGNNFMLFLDGVQKGSTYVNSNAFVDRTANLDIGAMLENSSYVMNGWIDAFRISNFARWTSNFTPPGEPS